jgi:hypothetical protein
MTVTKTLAFLATIAAAAAFGSAAMADSSSAPVTQSASGITDHSAVLHGKILNAPSLSLAFQYGTTTAYGSQTNVAPVLSSDALLASAPVDGLGPKTTYHYRLVATGLLGSTYGSDVKFTTAGVDGSGDGGGSGGGNDGLGDVTTGSGGDDSTDTSGTGGDGSGTSDGGAQPELGHKVVAGTSSGSVAVKRPGASRFAALGAGAPVPVGSILDARRGVVQLVTALSGGASQTGTFHGAVFQVRQSPDGGGMTDLVLRGGSFAGCKTSAAGASAAARPRVVRSLWGSDHHGRFRTRGSNSIATVRGTTWVTTDRCDGTLTKVSSGTVAVRDLRRKKTVVVHAGHSYLARGRR